MIIILLLVLILGYMIFRDIFPYIAILAVIGYLVNLVVSLITNPVFLIAAGTIIISMILGYSIVFLCKKIFN